MNDTATLNYNSSHTASSTPQFNLANIIRNIISDRTLSKGASDILIQLTLMSGRKGYCWPAIDTIVSLVRPRRTQVKLYLKELAEKGRIKIINRTGRSSEYQLLDILPEKKEPGRFSAYRKEYLRKENVIEKPNVILNFPQEETNPLPHSEGANTGRFVGKKSSPKQATDNNKIIIKPVDIKPNISTGDSKILPEAEPTQKHSAVIAMRLVSEILAVTGDKKSLGCFIKIVKDVPRNLIYAAISSLRIAIGEGIVSKPGAYFVQTIKNYNPDLFTSQKSCDVSLATPNRCDNIRLNISGMRSDPQPIINWEDNLAQIRALNSKLTSKLNPAMTTRNRRSK